jgi:hypothetical protein
MLEQDILKLYRIAIQTFTKLSSRLLPIKDEEKRYSDLRNYY